MAIRLKRAKRPRKKTTTIVTKIPRGPKRTKASGLYQKYGLDVAAAKWAELLADPCGAELTYPCFAGTNRGYLVRLKTSVVLGANFYIEWTPNMNAYTYINGTSPSTGYTPATVQGAFSYLDSGTAVSLSGIRAVAACMKVYTNDSEMNRSGILYMGHTTNQLQVNGTNMVNVANMASGLPHTTRVPDCTSEILWLPGEGDAIGNQLAQTGATDGATEAYNSVSAGVTGGASGGFTIELIGVYEVQPGNGTGIQSSYQRPVSSTPLNNVLRAVIDNVPLVKIGSQLMNKAIGFAGKVAGSFMGQTISKLGLLAL